MKHIERIEKRYVRVLKDINKQTRDLIKKVKKYYRYRAAGKLSLLKRSGHIDRLLNPSINGAREHLRKFRICACEILPGEANKKIVEELKKFSKLGGELIDEIDNYVHTKSLNHGYSAEIDLVKYLTRKTSAPISYAEHAQVVKHYVDTLLGCFYQNSESAYDETKALSDRPVSAGQFEQKTNRIITDLSALRGQVTIIAANTNDDVLADMEDVCRLNGDRRKEYDKVCELANEYTDLKLHALCRKAWLGGSGFPSTKSLHRYCQSKKHYILQHRGK